MQLRPNILVLGWYGHGNLGDESFRASFQSLWPSYDFVFKDHVPNDLKPYSACFIGGGSFLDAEMSGLRRLAALPVAFIGVGIGSKISDDFRLLLQRAKAILVRDVDSLARLPKEVERARVVFVADLFYARPPALLPCWQGQSSKLVTIFLSEHFVPRGKRPPWFYEGWKNFSENLAEVTDALCDRGFDIQFVPFSKTPEHDDRRPAAEVSSRKINAAKSRWEFPGAVTEGGVLDIISTSRLVLSVRLHGMIFASSVGCPFLAICGHDKAHAIAASMQWPFPVDLYQFRAPQILATIDAMLQQKAAGLEPKTLEAFQKWHVASEFVVAKLWR